MFHRVEGAVNRISVTAQHIKDVVDESLEVTKDFKQTVYNRSFADTIETLRV